MENNTINLYQPNMPIRLMDENGKKALADVIRDYSILTGLRWKELDVTQRILLTKQYEIIVKNYGDLSVEEVKQAFEMAYTGALKYCNPSDIRKNPTKILNVFISEKAEKQQQIWQDENESEEAKEVKRMALLERFRAKCEATIKRAKVISEDYAAGIKQYELAQAYDVLKDEYELDVEDKAACERMAYGQWMKRLEKAVVRLNYGITADVYSEILEQCDIDNLQVHSRLQELAATQVKAYYMIAIINFQIHKIYGTHN